jgi:hypothetical protein
VKRRNKRLTAMVVLAAVALPGAAVTYAAYTATTNNSGNQIESGSVQIGDNDGGSSALFSLTGMVPGTTDSGCIKVTYNGSLNSSVRLYGSTSGSGLDQYVDLKVTRGVNTPSDPAFDGCANFQADGTDYIGKGNGVVYDGTLQGFPDDYAGGLVDPTPGSPESWTNNESHVYRFTATLQSNILAEGKNATQTFTWEARNQ